MKNKKIKALIHSIGLENNLADEEVEKIVNSQFEFTKEKIQELNKKGLNKDNKKEFKQVIFHYKRIGKIFLNNNYGGKNE